MFRAGLGTLGERVASVLTGGCETDGLVASELDGDLAPCQAVARVDDCPDFCFVGSTKLRDGRQWHSGNRLRFDLGQTLRQIDKSKLLAGAHGF